MFKQLLILSIAILVFTGLCFAQTEVSGEVSGEWTRHGSPYIVIDSTWVPEGETLVVRPGVIVRFYPGLSFDIYGQITASGTENDSIYFISEEEDTTWSGIKLISDQIPEEFNYCVIHDAESAYILCINNILNVQNCEIRCKRAIIEERQQGLSERNNVNISNSYMSVYGRRGVAISFQFSRMSLSESVLVTTPSSYAAISIYYANISIEDCEITGSIRFSNTTSLYRNCRFTPACDTVDIRIEIGQNSSMLNCNVA